MNQKRHCETKDDRLNKLIDELAQDNAEIPVQHVPFRKVFIALFVALVLYVSLILSVGNPRPDFLHTLSTSPSYILELTLLTAFATSSLCAASLSSYPDFRGRKQVAVVSYLLLLTLTLAFYGWQLAHEPQNIIWGSPWHGLHCCFHIGLIALAPAIFISALLRRLASTEQSLTGIFIASSAFVVGALTLRMTEPIDWVGHIFLWHYLPLIVFSLLGVWLGPRLLRW